MFENLPAKILGEGGSTYFKKPISMKTVLYKILSKTFLGKVRYPKINSIILNYINYSTKDNTGLRIFFLQSENICISISLAYSHASY